MAKIVVFNIIIIIMQIVLFRIRESFSSGFFCFVLSSHCVCVWFATFHFVFFAIMKFNLIVIVWIAHTSTFFVSVFVLWIPIVSTRFTSQNSTQTRTVVATSTSLCVDDEQKSHKERGRERDGEDVKRERGREWRNQNYDRWMKCRYMRSITTFYWMIFAISSLSNCLAMNFNFSFFTSIVSVLLVRWMPTNYFNRSGFDTNYMCEYVIACGLILVIVAAVAVAKKRTKTKATTQDIKSLPIRFTIWRWPRSPRTMRK